MDPATLLEPGERPLLVIRAHWVAFWPQFAALLALAGLPAGFGLGFAARTGSLQGAEWRLVAAAAVAWIGFWLARALLARYRYDHTLWLLSDRRLLVSTAGAPFGSSLHAIALHELHEVRVHGFGPLRLLLGYGDVECRVGAGAGGLMLRRVPRPRQVALAVLQESVRARERLSEAGLGRGDTMRL